MTALARLLVRVFFRSIEIEDGENLPASGPVVLVANHTNGLVDGLLLLATLRRYPRFLGKSTLFGVPPLWPFLKLAGVIPVDRAIDAAAGDHNASAFATSHALLRQGGMVAVFPEGISHDETTLQPLKTGAARIALETLPTAGPRTRRRWPSVSSTTPRRAFARGRWSVSASPWPWRNGPRTTGATSGPRCAPSQRTWGSSWPGSTRRSPRGRKPNSSRGSPR